MKRVNFQVLRVAACIGVFVVHVGQRLELQGYLRKMTDLGAMGVYLFFIISGYLCFASFDMKNGGGGRTFFVLYAKNGQNSSGLLYGYPDSVYVAYIPLA